MKRLPPSVPPPPTPGHGLEGAVIALEGAAAALHDAATALKGAANRLAAIRPRARTGTLSGASPTPPGALPERERT